MEQHLEADEHAVADDEEEFERAELGGYLVVVLVVRPGNTPRARHHQPGAARGAFHHPVPLHLARVDAAGARRRLWHYAAQYRRRPSPRDPRNITRASAPFQPISSGASDMGGREKRI